MTNSKTNYNIEGYETNDNTREIYSSSRPKFTTQTIDDRTFCLCQSISKNEDSEKIKEDMCKFCKDKACPEICERCTYNTSNPCNNCNISFRNCSECRFKDNKPINEGERYG